MPGQLSERGEVRSRLPNRPSTADADRAACHRRRHRQQAEPDLPAAGQLDIDLQSSCASSSAPCLTRWRAIDPVAGAQRVKTSACAPGCRERASSSVSTIRSCRQSSGRGALQPD